MTESTAAGVDIDITVRDLIVSVVGEAEASNIDLDLVVYRQAGVLDVGDQARDGCVSVLPEDRVCVWAQGWPHTTETVPGAWDHYLGKVEED